MREKILFLVCGLLLGAGSMAGFSLLKKSISHPASASVSVVQDPEKVELKKKLDELKEKNNLLSAEITRFNAEMAEKQKNTPEKMEDSESSSDPLLINDPNPENKPESATTVKPSSEKD